MSSPKNTTAGMPDGWLNVWQEAQKQNAQAHSAFQQAMAQSHSAFMNSMATSMSALAGLSGIAPQTTVEIAPVVHTPLAPTVQPPAPVPQVMAAVTPQAPAPAPKMAAPELPPTTVKASPKKEAAPAAAPVAATAAAPSVDLQALMLEVVSEKTGYPAEMLEMSMDLEGDLGIDSIKRVQILAAVQDQAPGMPEVDANHMGALKTLGQIVEYMQELMGDVAPVAAANVAAAPAAPGGVPSGTIWAPAGPSLPMAPPASRSLVASIAACCSCTKPSSRCAV